MPKNPWTYKRRRRRRRTKSTEDGDFIQNLRMTNPNEQEIHIGSIKSEILAPPSKQLKKELIYPDTRFQRSTTLFPAMDDERLQSEIPSKTLKCVLREEKSSLEQEIEHVELYQVSDLDDNSIPIKVMPEVSRLKNYPLKNEAIIDPDTSFQCSTTLFSAQNIENIASSDTFKPNIIVRRKRAMQEKEHSDHYQMLDPGNIAISNSIMSEIPDIIGSDNPITNKDIYRDKSSQGVNPHFLAQEIENIMPSEKSSEILKCEPQRDAFETQSNKGQLPPSDDCVIIENSNSQVDLIDLTGNSLKIISQFITLD